MRKLNTQINIFDGNHATCRQLTLAYLNCGVLFPFWIFFVLQSGEMIVGPSKALFMDEISTGLDSSTTFQIVSCLQQLAHISESTILVSLLQPAPETFELFDDIILLSEGHIVYQGPRDLILDFFETMGFKCPDRKCVADFLQEVKFPLHPLPILFPFSIFCLKDLPYDH